MNSVFSTLKRQYFNKIIDGLHITECNCHDFLEMKGVSSFRRQAGSTLHYVLQGKGVLEIGDKKYDLKTGDFFYLPPAVDFSYYPDENNPWKYTWFYITGHLVENLFSDIGFSKESPVFSAVSVKEILECYSSMFTKLRNEPSSYELYMYSAFFNILALISEQRNNNTYTKYDIKGEHIKKIFDYINYNFTNPEFDIDLLSSLMILNHSYISRLFKAETGQTLKNYLVKKRIKYASELLISQPLTIKEIAYTCGFSDEVHFGKQFKKIMGYTASEYRKL